MKSPVSLRTHLFVGGVLRVLLIVYGDLLDRSSRNGDVKFTDVDYRVFTDAAKLVWEGGSPYERHTYRYTPILSWLLLPNIGFHPLFGKFVFCFADILVTKLLHSLTHSSSYFPLFWLYNPLIIGVSARGNAESILILLILTTLYLFKERVFFLSGIAFALSIHFKLYPIIYALSFYNVLTIGRGWRSLFDVNTARIRFVSGTVLTLILLTGFFYYIYGYDFLEHSYLYHLSRKDTRHNFSVYFYMLYLTVEEEDIGISLLTFIPQVVLLLGLIKKFGNWKDLSFCLFCQTFVFVAYNKVVTSQYFLWYIGLFPLVLSRLQLSKSEAITSGLLWGFAQGSWLLPAYFLEFRGYNTFQFIWIESLAFFCANIGLLSKFIRKYRELCCTDPVCDVHKIR
ncbi:LOW QUALITY PROTEIN: GPI mannosyltransferase 1 [Lepeophtheirus salmonis]|uniref:LOW QUALITY PROTEIN: GPI mannosyltransferase 1 n=1 Tax=Lepeophtheirus salmonis TaxID=72036 RepID=UPI001AEBA36C|nr:LOW QUALITY PROTEIN: GPI mannosyltransferase 1-like [Lepeophtheirus salmonis]